MVGAGALGAATAWQATQLGAEDVLVLEAGAPCSGTSPRGVGLVDPLRFRPEALGFVDRSLAAFRELGQVSDRFRFHATGGLLIAGPEHRDRVEQMRRVWRAHGTETARLGPGELDEVPGLPALELADDERAYLTEEGGWAVTTDAVHAMLDEACEHGAELRARTPVAGVEDAAVRLEDGQRLEADAVVLAAGVWTRSLFPGGWQPPVRAYRAQACVLAHESFPGRGPCVHDGPTGTYWRPEGEGKLMIGDGTDLASHDVDDQPRPDPRFAPRMLDRLRERWPEAKRASPVRAWAGFEAGTPDARPLVGPVPDRERVLLCTGGNGFGFMRSPALGEAAACLALGRAPPVPLEDCRPDRFPDPPESFPMQEGYALDG